MKGRKVARSVLLGISVLSYIILWAPALVLILFSFSKNRFGIKWEGFTLEWYANLLSQPAAMDALKLSILVVAIAIVVSSLGGTLAAYGLYKYQFKGRGILRVVSLLPLVMPTVVTGAAMLVYFTQLIHLRLGIGSVIIAHITFTIPLSTFVVLGRMSRIDWSLEEASIDLGANKVTTFWKITFPLLLPSIFASGLLIFPWSFNDFITTYFVAGVGVTTLPIYIFSQVRHSTTPIVNTIGAIFIIIPLLGTLFTSFFRNRKSAQSRSGHD
jgi:spermidine/putrescine transport system permease protein